MFLIGGEKEYSRRRPWLIRRLLKNSKETEYLQHTSSASKVLRMTETAAVFREARIRVSSAGENLQFLYCVLPSYKGFLAAELLEDAVCGTWVGIDIESSAKKATSQSQIQLP